MNRPDDALLGIGCHDGLKRGGRQTFVLVTTTGMPPTPSSSAFAAEHKHNAAARNAQRKESKGQMYDTAAPLPSMPPKRTPCSAPMQMQAETAWVHKHHL